MLQPSEHYKHILHRIYICIIFQVYVRYFLHIQAIAQCNVLELNK